MVEAVSAHHVKACGACSVGLQVLERIFFLGKGHEHWDVNLAAWMLDRSDSAAGGALGLERVEAFVGFLGENEQIVVRQGFPQFRIR